MESSVQDYILYTKGSDSSFVKLIRQYKDGLFLFMDCVTHHSEDAEKMMVRVFARLAKKRPRFYGKFGFKGFLYRYAYSEAIKWKRRNRRSGKKAGKPEQDIKSARQLEVRYLGSQTAASARRLLRDLPEKNAMILYLIHFEGFSIAETGDIVRTSGHRVKRLLTQGRILWKQKMDEEGLHYEGLS